jgi:hypothetical protein
MTETLYGLMRRQGIARRSYLKFRSLTAASQGLAPAFGPRIAWPLENKPRTPGRAPGLAALNALLDDDVDGARVTGVQIRSHRPNVVANLRGQ